MTETNVCSDLEEALNFDVLIFVCFYFLLGLLFLFMFSYKYCFFLPFQQFNNIFALKESAY